MKNTLCALLALLCCQFAFAQQESLSHLSIETRADYQREYIDGEAINDNCGFKGQYLNIRMDGRISDKLTYSYRQRLNRAHTSSSFFNATDWLNLQYQMNEHWALSAGKQVIALGGYECARAPIDLYFGSEYGYNFTCYLFGASIAYSFSNGKDQLIAQICESPFRLPGEDMYAYNLLWNGSHGWFNSTYSINMFEYAPGKFINHISLGSKFNVGDFSLELDIMNRAVSNQTFLLKDISVTGDLSYSPSQKWNFFTKVSYDVNATSKTGNRCVMSGTEITRVGAGIEYFPLEGGNRNVRLHAVFSQTFGHNSNPAGALFDKQSYFSAGLKWKVDLLALRNNLREALQ